MASADCQGWGRAFESPRPLHFPTDSSHQGARRFAGGARCALRRLRLRAVLRGGAAGEFPAAPMARQRSRLATVRWGAAAAGAAISGGPSTVVPPTGPPVSGARPTVGAAAPAAQWPQLWLITRGALPAPCAITSVERPQTLAPTPFATNENDCAPGGRRPKLASDWPGAVIGAAFRAWLSMAFAWRSIWAAMRSRSANGCAHAGPNGPAPQAAGSAIPGVSVTFGGTSPA